MHFDPITGEKIMDPGDEVQVQNTQAAGQTPAQAAQAMDQAAAQAAQTLGADAAQAAQAAGQAQANFNQAAQGQAQGAPAGDAMAQAQQAYDQAQAMQAAATQQNFQQGQFQQGQFQQAQGQFGQAPADGNKVKKGLPIGAVIGIIVAVIAVIGGVIFFATRSMGGKISLLTLGSTAYDGCYVADAIKEAGFKPYSDMSLTVNAEVEDFELSVVAARKVDSHVGSLYAEMTYSGFTASATGYIDEKKIKASCPVISDYLFVYDYSSKNNDGYIAELLDDQGIDIEDFNTMIAFFNDNSDLYRKFSEKTMDYYKDCINGIDLEKTGNKDTFTVNGKEITCKEYKAVITEDDMAEWIKGYQELLSDFVDDNSDEFEVLEEISGEDFDVEDEFDVYLDEIEDMEDLEITVYAKGTTVAAIGYVYDDEEVQILFKGGDYLAQNLEVIVDDDTVLTIEGEIKGDVETSTIEADDYTIEWSYDRKSGKLTIECDDFEFEGKLVTKKGEMTISIDSLEVDGDEIEIDKLEIIYSSNADIKEPKGDEFDIGTADEDEFEDLGEEIYENVYDNDDLMDFLDDLQYMF